MHLEKFLNTQSGKYIMSMLLGFGLATLFRTVCTGNKCILVKGPDIKDKIFKQGDKCQSFKYTPVSCNSNRRQVFL